MPTWRTVQRAVLFALLALAAAQAGAASRYSVTLDPRSFGVDEAAELTITVTGDEDATPIIPHVPGLVINPDGQSSSVQQVNGAVTAIFSRSYRVTAKEIISFGEKYDPQPFHIDEAAGKVSFFSGLCASGWLTAAIVMRLRVESIRIAGGMIGAGVEEIRWTQPVRPEDTLRTEAEILNVRLSSSRPAFGVVRSRTTVYNQRDEVVMRSVVNFIAPVRGD